MTTYGIREHKREGLLAQIAHDVRAIEGGMPSAADALDFMAELRKMVDREGVKSGAIGFLGFRK